LKNGLQCAAINEQLQKRIRNTELQPTAPDGTHHMDSDYKKNSTQHFSKSQIRKRINYIQNTDSVKQTGHITYINSIQKEQHPEHKQHRTHGHHRNILCCPAPEWHSNHKLEHTNKRYYIYHTKSIEEKKCQLFVTVYGQLCPAKVANLASSFPLHDKTSLMGLGGGGGNASNSASYYNFNLLF
jgi:hypothetical protein